MSDEVLLIERKDAVLWLTLNRPAAMNAVSPALMAALDHAIGQAESDDAIRCVVITGAGKAFCAGADLKAVRRELGSEEGGIAHFLKFAAAVMTRIEALPKPVVAAVNGLAVAGGLEIVLACDLVLATQSAKLGDAHINFGLLPGGGSSVRLPRKLGVNRAKYLLYSGDALPAAEFVACGFVHQVVADDALLGAAEKLALKLASKSPLALRRMKQLVAGALDRPQEAALQMELLAIQAHAHSHDLQEGLAAFAERRAPNFTGR